MPMMHSTRKCSGSPKRRCTNASDVAAVSCVRLRICTQQLPRPMDAAASCRTITAMEQSSIQTSDCCSSPRMTTAGGVPIRKAEPDCLARESCSSSAGSSTKMNSRDCKFLDVGERSKASFKTGRLSDSTFWERNLRMLQRRRRILIIISLPDTFCSTGI